MWYERIIFSSPMWFWDAEFFNHYCLHLLTLVLSNILGTDVSVNWQMGKDEFDEYMLYVLVTKRMHAWKRTMTHVLNPEQQVGPTNVRPPHCSYRPALLLPLHVSESSPRVCTSKVFFKIELFYSWFLWPNNFFYIIKINKFWGDLSGISAKTATLVCTHSHTSLEG